MVVANPLLVSPLESTNPRLEKGGNPFAELYRGKPDAVWQQDIDISIEQPVVNDVAFPRFPPAAMQERIHGHSNLNSLREAFLFYYVCRKYAYQLRRGFDPAWRLLDFGSGWGRIIRPFLREFELNNIFGYEPNPWFCQVARSLNPYVTFVNGNAVPPSIFAGDSFDLITGWSVFSHLPMDLARSWLGEFERIAKPGAMICLTTWGQRFIDRLAAADARKKAGEGIHFYEGLVLGAAGSLDKLRARFANGDFIFLQSGANENYGETFIPTAAFERLLPSRLEIADVDLNLLPQDFFVIRKKS